MKQCAVDRAVGSSAIRPEVLALLACPVPDCRAALLLRERELVCERCGRRYRLEEDWPVLIPEEAVAPPAEPGDGSAHASAVRG